MGKSKSVAGKKRNASSNIQSKPSKSLKKTVQPETKPHSDDLFDNLDEEMDQEEMERLVKQINNEDESSHEDDEVEEEQYEEEEYEPNEFDEINFDEEEQEQNKEVVVEEDAMEEEDQPAVEKESTFRDLYMAKVTQAFGSDLDTIRQEANFNGARLNILIDSLEAGIDIFSSTEQEIILADEKK